MTTSSGTTSHECQWTLQGEEGQSGGKSAISASWGTPKAAASRKRPSRRAVPTTLLTANTANFRSLVQKFTGCSSAKSARQRGPVTLSFGPANEDNGPIYYADHLPESWSERNRRMVEGDHREYLDAQTASHHKRERLTTSANTLAVSERDSLDMIPSGTTSVSDFGDLVGNDSMEIFGEFVIDDIHALLNSD